MPLLIVATPIGNLEDLTPRAGRTLREADLIVAEDTRRAAKLLAHLGIEGKTVLRYDEHSHERVLPRILDELRIGRAVAAVTDAGTPAVSDPGGRLVAAVRRELPDVSIVPIPGPSAVTTLLSVAGFSSDQFFFAGFPPHKKGREKFFKDLARREEIVVLFESPHRILKTLDAIAATFGPNRQIAIGRELTKVHETITVGSVAEVTEKVKSGSLKGEFVLCLNSTSQPRSIT